MYKANNDTEARKASEAAVRDTRINWSTLQWAKSQASNGKSKVFYYYFAHHPRRHLRMRPTRTLGRILELITAPNLPMCLEIFSNLFCYKDDTPPHQQRG
jgi:hypothetical protein